MASFQYFLPNQTAENVVAGAEIKRQLLAEVGLADVLADVSRVPQHVAVCGVDRGKGPGGQSGVILAPKSKASGTGPKIGHFPDRQHWQPRASPADPEGKLAWIGWFKAEPPVNYDLERFQVVGGYKISDPHNYEWQIPVALSPRPTFAYGTLPQSYVFDAQGEPSGVLDPEYTWLWELGAELREWYRRGDAGEDRQPIAWLIKQAVRILQVNYRVGQAELTTLHQLGRGVLSQEVVHAICQAIFDFKIVEEAKKNLSGERAEKTEGSIPALPSSCSTTGDATQPDSPGTDPPGAG